MYRTYMHNSERVTELEFYKRVLKTWADVLNALRSRVKYDVTISQLANDVGVSRSYLSEILSGKKVPGEDVLNRLGYEVRFIDSTFDCLKDRRNECLEK